MEDCCVHHVEFGVKNGNDFQRKFIQQYQFFLAATRKTESFMQWVLKSGTATVVITESLATDNGELRCDEDYIVGWKYGRLDKITDLDSVYNVALTVKNLQLCVDRLTKCGVDVLRPCKTVNDEFGTVTYAVVRSCVGNVVHTLIQENDYKGVFLPGFDPVNIEKRSHNTLVTHFDHVTFSCACGDSNSILDWYSRCFGMQRFFINRTESEEDGFVIDSEDIGLRLKVFEYWRCAETGLTTSSRPGSIKFVIGEPLPGQGPNQIDTFLREHGGPGVQHIGLHTYNIVSTVATLHNNGVQFAEPPYTYYTEIGKLKEIHEIGEDVEVLKQNGILVDAEADPDSSGDSQDLKYLMQKFTKPLFNCNTFFLEIIQRVGARGFGSGNITALWRSVQAYMNEAKS